MILDSSAIVAMLLREPESDQLIEKVTLAQAVGVGAPTLAEAAIVLSARLGQDCRGLLSRFLEESGAVVIPFDRPHYVASADAWLRYGRGRHPAALNFGDCLSYAVAQVAQQPLLCTGGDFPQTDLELA